MEVGCCSFYKCRSWKSEVGIAPTGHRTFASNVSERVLLCSEVPVKLVNHLKLWYCGKVQLLPLSHNTCHVS